MKSINRNQSHCPDIHDGDGTVPGHRTTSVWMRSFLDWFISRRGVSRPSVAGCIAGRTGGHAAGRIAVRVASQGNSRIANRAGSVIWWLTSLLAIVGLAVYLWVAPAPRNSVRASEIAIDGHDQIEGLQRANQSRLSVHGHPPVIEQSGKTREVNQQEATQEAQALSFLKGEWVGYYQGNRRLLVREDGTGTMVAEPEGLAATLLAPKLIFEIRWQKSGDRFDFETIGGEPKDKVDLVSKLYGAKRSHRIVKCEADLLVLLDEDGVTQYEWRRE